MSDIYSVLNVNTNKIIESGFDKKADAKTKRNELCKEAWAKWSTKAKDDKDLKKPYPYIIVKGKEHPRYE